MEVKKFKISGKKRQVLISMCIFMGQMVLGFTIGWIGPVLTKLYSYEQSPINEKPTNSQLSLLVSSLYIGSIPGPYLMGWLSNIKGRKPCLVLGGIISALAYIILATLRNLPMLFFGRILSGVGYGIIGVMNLVYIGEIASTNIRGILLTALGIFMTCGGIVSYIAAEYLTYAWMNCVGVCLCLMFTGTALLIPESPIFYVLKGNDETIISSLIKLGRNDEIHQLLAAKKDYQDTTAMKDWIDLFKIKSNLKALGIVMALNIFQQCSGVMIVLFFASNIFHKAGIAMNSGVYTQVIFGAQLFGSCICTILVEKSGRKNLLGASSAMCSSAMFLLGLYFYLDNINNYIIEYLNWLPVITLIFFLIAYNFGLGIIPHAMIGEMFTANVRSNASTVALTLSWVVGLLLSTTFGMTVNAIGTHIAFWIYAGASVFSTIFAAVCVPETKGKSLLEIQKDMSK